MRRETWGGSWSLELDVALWATSDPTQPAQFPLVCATVRLKRPGNRTGELALDMIRAMRRNGHNPKLLTSDMAIVPGADPEKLQNHLYDMGIDTCIHIDEGHKGMSKDGHEGLIWVDGNPYCGAMPAKLISCTKDRHEKLISQEVFYKRLWERRRYLAKPNGKPNSKGGIQYLHPTDEAGRPVCNPGRPHAGKFCTQRSVVVPKERLNLKYRQKYHYMGPEWARMHFAGRSSIEGYNGTFKKVHRFGDPDQVTVRGYAAKYLAAAMMVVASNARIVENFYRDSPDQVEARFLKAKKRRAGTWSEAMHDAEFWNKQAETVLTDEDDPPE